MPAPVSGTEQRESPMKSSLRTAAALLMVSFATATPHQARPQPAVVECNGSDVTLEVQQFIEDSPDDLSFLQFTAGECVINQTVKICNKSGLRIEGAGRGSTVLVWAPTVLADKGPMFSIQNSAAVQFAHFGVCIGPAPYPYYSLDSAFDLYNSCHDCSIVQDDDVGTVVDHCSPATEGY